MKTIVIVLVMTLAKVFITPQNNVPVILDHYIKLKDALVKSDSKQVSLKAIELSKSLDNDSNIKDLKPLSEALEKIVKANDIEKQREAFSKVSTILWDLVKPDAQINGTIYYQYCPMKKAYWLSFNKEIKNPYYGSKMLSCGSESEPKN
ncbi:DUF3347 domain-containing protein [Mariniflexile soesokkakense]|uniref:DUF3347 domain-containing protein n=1 Tax=Mariniflexile soesokkakense TaxID=1343160 RepID=A0ABV0ACY9_9FLAO